jgi:hypothetical protein
MGDWQVSENGEVLFMPAPPPVDATWSPAARANLKKTTETLKAIKIEWFSDGPLDILLPRDVRRYQAEQLLTHLAQACNFKKSPTSMDREIWASDGSMLPAAVGIGDDKSVTAAVTGPITMVVKILGHNCSILQGELMGLIMGLIFAGHTSETPQIYSDHMNTTRLIHDSNTHVNQDARVRHMNARSYYRWILTLAKEKRAMVHYTRGHSDGFSIPSQMNNEADHYASSAQRALESIPHAPSPTFFMDDYTFYRENDGWIESNTRTFIDFFLTRESSCELDVGHQQRMAISFYDKTTPPDYPYLRAVSAHSALVQLYARSGQLATADLLYSRGKLGSNRCRFGCEDVEDMHHLFVECARFTKWREEVKEDLLRRTKRKLDDLNIEEAGQDGLLMAVKSLFKNDSSIWPLHYSFYYVGHMPNLDKFLTKDLPISQLARRRLLHNLSADWHLFSIRLAGRIFGEVQREMARRNETEIGAGRRKNGRK